MSLGKLIERQGRTIGLYALPIPILGPFSSHLGVDTRPCPLVLLVVPIICIHLRLYRYDMILLYLMSAVHCCLVNWEWKDVRVFHLSYSLSQLLLLLLEVVGCHRYLVCNRLNIRPYPLLALRIAIL